MDHRVGASVSVQCAYVICTYTFNSSTALLLVVGAAGPARSALNPGVLTGA